MTIVYLHGFASGPSSAKAQYFRRQFEGLGITLEIPDLGEGAFERLTITGQLRVIEKMAAGKAVDLIGSSMGGYLAALYAARHPEVRRLVMLAPAFGFALRWPQTLGEDRLRRWKQTGWLPIYHYAERRQTRVGYDLLEDGARYEEYPEITQPALVFHGRHDDVVPCAYSEEFATRNKPARVEILDSGHELLSVLDYMWSETRRFLLE